MTGYRHSADSPPRSAVAPGMAQTITGVFEGGGVRGIALAGAAAGALDSGFEFERLVGTPAGAIVSSLVAAGFGSRELREAVSEVRWLAWTSGKSAWRKNFSMVTRLGFHSGCRLEAAIRDLLTSKGVRTFSDLPRGSLRVVATDLNHGRGLVLPDALPALGHDADSFAVAKAVLMSASVPFVFEPVRLHDRITGEDLLMADGAMTARFPTQLVPRDFSAVGFRLKQPPDEHRHRQVNGPVSLATAVIGAGITAREDLPPLCGPLRNVVEVTLAQDSLDFDISPARVRALFDTGYEAAVDKLGPLWPRTLFDVLNPRAVDT